MDIEDVTVLDGAWSSEEPCVILDARFARRALNEGASVLAEVVGQGLAALELFGEDGGVPP